VTKCLAYWNKVRQFREKDDFAGFCSWCKTDQKHLQEEWKIVALMDRVQICTEDKVKVAADAWRPLIRKENELVLPKVLKMIESFLKNGDVLTRQKTEEFILRASGALQTPTPPRPLVECELCLSGTTNPVVVDGHNYCSEEHARQGQFKPAKIQKKTYESPFLKKTWPERKELMHAPVSQMEEWLRKKLSEKGVNFLTDQEFCVVKTRPDFYFPDANLALYLDGERVHRDRVHKDDKLRNEFKRNTGIDPLGLTYKDTTQKSKDEVLAQIMEAIT